MNKLHTCAGLAALVALPGLAAADGPHSLTGNVGLVSDYAFRGVSQTAGDPAIQGGFDYAHASGFYLGTWASNVSEAMYDESLVGSGTGSANLEWDFYGGYSGKVGEDFGYNVGLLKYYYPGATDYDTLEAYAGVTWKWFGLKASYSLDDYFGVPNSDGTVYWDASFSYELPAKVMLSAHYGWTRFSGAGNGALDYEDWKIGVSKEFGGFNFGLAYTDTDLPAAHVKGENVTDGRWIVSVGKAF